MSINKFDFDEDLISKIDSYIKNDMMVNHRTERQAWAIFRCKINNAVMKNKVRSQNYIDLKESYMMGRESVLNKLEGFLNDEKGID